MKIAIVHSFYSRHSPSGENTVVADQADQLRSYGYDVRLVSKETDAEAQRPLYGARAALAAANLIGPDPEAELREFDPDVVHVHNLFPNWGTGWLARWGKKTVQTLHNYRSVCAAATLFRDGSPCTECLDRTSLRAVVHKCYRGSVVATLPLAIATRGQVADRPALAHPHTLVTLNSAAESLFKGYLPNARIVTVPNFAKISAEKTMTGSTRFLYVGRLTDEKGIVRLLDSWPEDQSLDVIGNGPLEDVVSNIAQRSSSDIEFLGRKESSEALRLIGAAAGLVIPSLWSEGIPTVALESLAAGTPLVVSKKLASADTLTFGGGGAEYDPFEKESLASALGAVLQQGDTMRTQARSNYQRRFSADEWQRSMTKIYERVVADNVQ